MADDADTESFNEPPLTALRKECVAAETSAVLTIAGNPYMVQQGPL
jgi:hypothetical protein